MTDDDDYPVLTQVLRTGAGARVDLPASIPDETALEPLGVPALQDATAARLEAVDVPDAKGADDPQADGDGAADDFGIEPYLGDGGTHPYGTLPLETDASPAAADAGAAEGGDDRRAASALAFEDEAHVVTGPSTDDGALAFRVRAAVLEDLGARIDTEFDARIAQVLHAEIETAVAHLQQALRDHLAEALRDVVGRAIEAEVVRLQAAGATGKPIG